MYRINDKTSAIRQIQNYLRLIGNREIFIASTGEYDENTILAVKDYQKSKNLEANGIVDYITFNSIYEDYTSLLNKNANDKNSILIKFPITPGDNSDILIQINIILSYLMDYYGHSHNIRKSTYYSKETADAVRILRKIYLMEDLDLIDDEFYKKIICDINSSNDFNNIVIY